MKMNRLIWTLCLTAIIAFTVYLTTACDSEMLDKFDGRICVGAVWGQVSDTQDDPLGGVDVTLRDGIGTSMRTNDNGYFVIIGASVGEEMDVRFDKDGYARTHKPVNLMEGFVTSMETKMKKVQRLGKRSLDVDLNEKLDDGSRISFPPGALVDPDGNVAAGDMDIAITGLRVETDDIDAAPGNFFGRDENGNDTKIESFGMIDMNFTQGGEKLQLAPGETAQVEFEVGTLGREEGEVIPLWYYDSDEQKWMQEGECEVMQTDDEGTLACVGEVSHFSIWNSDMGCNWTCVKGKLRDNQGDPVAGAMMLSYSQDVNTCDYDYSREDGSFQLSMKVSDHVNVKINWQGRNSSIPLTAPSEQYHTFATCKDIGDIVFETGETTDDDGRDDDLSDDDDDDNDDNDDSGRDDDDDSETESVRLPGSDEPLTLCVDVYDEIEKACGEDM